MGSIHWHRSLPSCSFPHRIQGRSKLHWGIPCGSCCRALLAETLLAETRLLAEARLLAKSWCWHGLAETRLLAET